MDYREIERERERERQRQRQRQRQTSIHACMSPVLLEAGGLLKVGGQLLGLLRLDVELGAARFDFMGKGGHFWVLVFRWFRYMFELL